MRCACSVVGQPLSCHKRMPLALVREPQKRWAGQWAGSTPITLETGSLLWQALSQVQQSSSQMVCGWPIQQLLSQPVRHPFATSISSKACSSF